MERAAPEIDPHRPSSRPSRPAILSIIGSGRSGSTLLDIALGSHPLIEGVGALQKLPRSGWIPDDDRRCSCGEPIHRCPFWTAVLERWTGEVGDRDAVRRYVELQDGYERSNRLWPRLLIEERRPSPTFTEYATMTGALYRAIADESGKPFVLDSSKKPIRTYALIAIGALDVRVIHLVRDGRGVVWSRRKALDKDVTAGVPSARSSTAAWRTSMHWAQANVESGIVARHGDGTVRITYEALVSDPIGTLGRLSPLVGEDLSELGRALLDGTAFPPGHRVAGNRMRLAGPVRLRPDLEWTEKLSDADARTFWLMAGWLARRYGYTR